MTRRAICLIASTLTALATSSLCAQEPKAAPPQTPAPDYKVLFWYDRNDPGMTFRHVAYDVRKGQYDTRAVSAWLDLIKRDYPHYRAFVRDVYLANYPGETDAQKLRVVVQGELESVALLRLPPGTLSTLSQIGRSGPMNVPSSRTFPMQAPGGGGLGSSPTNPSPFPYPYTRPHP